MSLVSELRRRNVFRMVVLYLVAAWLVMQVAEVVIGLAAMPEWVGQTILVLLAIGFPIALILSWIYELTPQGVALEEDIEPSKSIARASSRRLDFVVIALMTAALIMFAYDKWWPDEPAARSIAVLPFRVVSGTPEVDHFADGMHDDILSELTKLSSFDTVISRTSVEKLRDTSKSVSDLGKELGVETVLEGSVQGGEGSVHINIHLIDTASGKHLLAKRYGGKLSLQNIFRLQEDVARDIARTLSLTITPQEEERLTTTPTDSMVAYRNYHLGIRQLNTVTVASTGRAIKLFEAAIAADPQFAQAYAYLGLAHVYRLTVTFGDSLSTFERAREMGERALEIDPLMAEGLVVLGVVAGLGDWKLEQAREHFETAIDLNPGLALAWENYGVILTIHGLYDEAISKLEVATRQSPLDSLPHVSLGENYAMVGRVEDALTAVHVAHELAPERPFNYEIIGDTYGLSVGRLDTAIRWYEEGQKIDPESIRWKWRILAFSLDLGDLASVRRLLADEPQFLKVLLMMRTGKFAETRDIAEIVWRDNRYRLIGELLQQQYMNDGQYELALEINDEQIRQYGPTIPHPEDEVTAGNFSVSLLRAAIFLGIGEKPRASSLLRDCLDVSTSMPGRGEFFRQNFRLVQIYSLMGDMPMALAALRQAIDEGRRSGWWIDLVQSPLTASLRKQPQFGEMINEIKADMASQLASLLEMQESGELPFGVPQN